jgi:hypothetical protein
MPKTLICVGTMILVLGVAAAGAETSRAAGPLVRLELLGSGAYLSNPSTKVQFESCLQYDSSATGSGFYFNFTGSTRFDHEICYRLQNGVFASGTMGTCEPYSIQTSLNNDTTFQLQATLPSGTAVTVTIPSNVTFTATALPLCESGAIDVFPVGGGGGTFTLSNATTGAVIYTGTITSIKCSQPLAGTHCSCPNIFMVMPSPQGVAYDASPLVYAASQAYPVYACPPRQGCCLTRLFARRSRCNSCW